MSFRFRTFPIYEELKLFIVEIYKLSKTLPAQEQFELASQLRRAATSALLNLAEGSSRNSDAEMKRFLYISVASIGEVVAILDICLDLKYINSSLHNEFVLKCENITKQLYGFIRKINKTINK